LKKAGSAEKSDVVGHSQLAVKPNAKVVDDIGKHHCGVR